MKTFSLKYSAVLIALFFLLTQIKLAAQNYTLSPGKTYVTSVDTSQLNYNGIIISNTGTTNLDFTWDLLLKDTLIDSEFDLCNSGVCFNTLPASGTMPTITPGQKGHLKLHMFSGQKNGTNTIKYILKNAALSSSDTLTFIINVGDVTGLFDKKAPLIKTSLFPNPTVNETTLTIDLISQSNVTVSVLSTIGEVVYKSASTLNSGCNILHLDTQNLAPGIYNVVISSSNGAITKKLSVTK